MPSEDIAISARSLRKTYRLFRHPGDRIKQFFSLSLRQYHREFTALKDASFDIKKGEIVGIIGRNGSGKSTLLQLICGILKPTSGTVTVRGRISALLELGAGFNPEFTGRENVYFQGALMGFTEAQMSERFKDISAFADIGEYIDEPVRTYSSGMFVRLAFATAIHVDPDILVIDEALAVGDLSFQQRSFSKIEKILSSGQCTVVIVSHDLRQIERFCTRAFYLRKGDITDFTSPLEACKEYQKELNKEVSLGSLASEITGSITSSGEANLISLEAIDQKGHRVDSVHLGDSIKIRLIFSLSSNFDGVELIIGTQSQSIPYLSASSTIDSPQSIFLTAGTHIVEHQLQTFPVAPGTYSLRVVIRDKTFRILLSGERLCPFAVVGGADEFNRPPRLLDLKSRWSIDGMEL